MAAVEVACPGCKATLKAPDSIAGKKVRCKKCNTPFRVPGPSQPGDSVADSQMLSAIDSPLPPTTTGANPFDFAAPEPPPEPKKPEPKPEPKTRSNPGSPGLAAPKEKSTPKAKALPPEPKRTPPTAANAAFDFGAMLDTPPTPQEETLDLNDDPVSETESLEELATNSDEPFGFSASTAPAKAGPSSSRGKLKGLPAAPVTEAKSHGHHHGYRPSGGGGGKAKLILAVVGLLALGGAIAGVAMYVNKHKGNEQAQATDEDKDKDKKPETTPEPVKNDPGTGKNPTTGKEPKGSKGTGTNPGTKTGGGGPERPLLVLTGLRGIKLQPPSAKPALLQEPNAPPVPIEVEFGTVRRFFPPARSENDIVVVWEKEKGFQGGANKLVLDLCRPSGVRQAQIEFAGDGKPVPACDVSDDSLWFVHTENSKLTVWKLEDQSTMVDGMNLALLAPEVAKGGVVAVYFLPLPGKEMPPSRVVTVCGHGVVHLWDLAEKKLLGEYIPPTTRLNKVSDLRAVTLSLGRRSVVVAVGGKIYDVQLQPNLSGVEVADLEGEPAGSLALATYGPERLLYVFEMGEKKEVVVSLIPRNGKLQNWRWPEAAGKPVVAGWVDQEKVVVGSDRGSAVWFDYTKEDEKDRFVPYGAAVATGDKAHHAINDLAQWYLIPSAADPKKCDLCQLGPVTPDLLGGGKDAGISTWQINAKGLFK